MTTNTHTVHIRQGHGRGSVSMDERGDFLMYANYDFTLVTGAGETPEFHREVMMRVIDEQHKSLKEYLQGANFWSMYKA